VFIVTLFYCIISNSFANLILRGRPKRRPQSGG